MHEHTCTQLSQRADEVDVCKNLGSEELGKLNVLFEVSGAKRLTGVDDSKEPRPPVRHIVDVSGCALESLVERFPRRQFEEVLRECVSKGVCGRWEVTEEDVFFRAEVSVEGAGGYSRGNGDVIDGRVIEAVLLEQAQGNVGEFFPQHLPGPLPNPGHLSSSHAPIIPADLGRLCHHRHILSSAGMKLRRH